ncbi:MAG: DUF502 domain-containing protein [Betaproteobacteria bacterium]|nr:DUF502 domain-containing protein [Betaproteobacteria bacterium]
MKKYLITGLLIWIPVVITIWVLEIIVTTMDQTLTVIPEDFKPRTNIPGLGLLLTLVVVYLTGLFTSNFLGRWVMRVWEGVLRRIPVVNSIYGGVKQVSDTLFTPGGQAFRKALLVQYPRSGSWTIAFMTGQPGGEVANHLNGDYVSVYVPTTPNPTSGFFLMMLRSEVVELEMSVDEALKYVVSMGVVPPRASGRKPALPGAK